MKFKILCIFSCHLSTNSSRSFHEQLQLRCIIVKLLILIRYVYSAIRILAHRRLLILMLRVFNLLLRRIHVKYAGELLHDLILRQISEHIIPFNVQCIPSSNQSRIRLIERYRWVLVIRVKIHINFQELLQYRILNRFVNQYNLLHVLVQRLHPPVQKLYRPVKEVLLLGQLGQIVCNSVIQILLKPAMHVVETWVASKDRPDLGEQPYLDLVVDVSVLFDVFEDRYVEVGQVELGATFVGH